MAARNRRCPTPEKVIFALYRDAVAAARKQLPYRVLKPYKCKGHWHLARHTYHDQPRRNRR